MRGIVDWEVHIMTDHPNIEILNAVHTIAEMDEIIEALADTDVLFFECFGFKDEAMQLTTVMNTLMSKDPYTKEFENEIVSHIDNNVYLLLAWRLKGTGKRAFPIDIWYERDEPEKYANNAMPYTIEKALIQIRKNPKDRYNLFKSMLSDVQIGLRLRNRIMISQVQKYIELDKPGIWRDIFEDKGSCKISIFVGYLHWIHTGLRKALPEYEIDVKVISKEEVVTLRKYNVAAKCVYQYLLGNNELFTDRYIDYALLRILSVHHYDNEKSANEDSPSLQEVMADNARILAIPKNLDDRKHMIAFLNSFKPLKEYTTKELSDEVEVLLAK